MLFVSICYIQYMLITNLHKYHTPPTTATTAAGRKGIPRGCGGRLQDLAHVCAYSIDMILIILFVLTLVLIFILFTLW